MIDTKKSITLATVTAFLLLATASPAQAVLPGLDAIQLPLPQLDVTTGNLCSGACDFVATANGPTCYNPGGSGQTSCNKDLSDDTYDTLVIWYCAHDRCKDSRGGPTMYRTDGQVTIRLENYNTDGTYAGNYARWSCNFTDGVPICNASSTRGSQNSYNLLKGVGDGKNDDGKRNYWQVEVRLDE